MTNDPGILIQACLQRKSRAQEQLYRHLYPLMINLCIRYAGDRDGASIIFNNAMLKVFGGLEKYQEQGSFIYWVRTIVVRAALDYLQQKIVFDPIAADQSTATMSVNEDALLQLSVKEIKTALQALPPATRTVCFLYWYEGYRHREIAALLNITEGTSKWHLNQAKKTLMAVLNSK